MNKRIANIIILSAFTLSVSAQTWIWYPGDFEIWLGNNMNNRRTDRGTFFPPFWKSESHYVTVEFSKKISLDRSETIRISAEGKYNVKIDGKLMFGMPHKITLDNGFHSLNIKVWNQSSPPSIFVDGNTIKSDSTWKVTNEDKEWIDESGKASDTSASIYMDAGSWNFNTKKERPSLYKLKTEPRNLKEYINSKYPGKLYDAGAETFGYITLKGIKGKGQISIYYGESKEEAMDTDKCETLDRLSINNSKITNLSTNETSDFNTEYTINLSKAFRYIYIVTNNDIRIEDVSMKYEYQPEVNHSSFECNDETINKIWNIGIYTLGLTTREFFIDGIKRDRWTWSGDAYQSYLMNYYSFFDSNCVKRTIWQLRGKDPVTSHINTIMDYTFYWFLGIYDYYMYSGDKHFLSQIYPRMQTMMDYVLGRLDNNGMVTGLTGDWVFVDWADKPMDKHGDLSFEQVLFCKSLETMTLCAKVTGNDPDADKYQKLYTDLKAKLIPTFWNEKKQAMVHNCIEGKQSEQITRYSNIFATLYNYLTEKQKQEVKSSVLENNNIMKITTPYMRFYELEALCAMGEQANVTKQIKDYWGGMIHEGATSFWEKYNPDEKGKQHLAMYGRPYGKSLCHAWGASPVYLLGKYYLGVKPIKEGYKEFSITPVLGGLKWIHGTVPTPNGCVKVYADKNMIRVKATEGNGYLYFHSTKNPQTNIGEINRINNNYYRIWVNTNQEVVISR